MTAQAPHAPHRAHRLGCGGTGLLLSGCDRIMQIPGALSMLESAENLSRHAQRAVLATADSLAREYPALGDFAELRANGTTRPQSDEYAQLAMDGFADYRLKVDGLVARPLRLLARRISRVCRRARRSRGTIASKAGARSANGRASRSPRCSSRRLGSRHALPRLPLRRSDGRRRHGLYYESIDLVDAYHPQTIMAYAMNGQTLPIPHGAPLRLRVERQLGYKMAKYVMRIEAVRELRRISAAARGGFWEDRGYEWYAGI